MANNYKYTIEKVSRKHKIIRVRYNKPDGSEPYWKNFNPSDPSQYNQAQIDQMAKDFAPTVLKAWDYIDNIPEIDPGDIDLGVEKDAVYTPPDPIPEPTDRQKREKAREQVKIDREEQEAVGTGNYWVDDGQGGYIQYKIDTRPADQHRLTMSEAAGQGNVGGPAGADKLRVWRYDSANNDEEVAEFIDLTMQKRREIMEIVRDFTDRLDRAEANALAKINANDFTASFQEEYSLLVQAEVPPPPGT